MHLFRQFPWIQKQFPSTFLPFVLCARGGTFSLKVTNKQASSASLKSHAVPDFLGRSCLKKYWFYPKVQHGQCGGNGGADCSGHQGEGEGGRVRRGGDSDADQEVERVEEKKPPHLPTQHWPLKVQKDGVKSNDAYNVNQSQNCIPKQIVAKNPKKYFEWSNSDIYRVFFFTGTPLKS